MRKSLRSFLVVSSFTFLVSLQTFLIVLIVQFLVFSSSLPFLLLQVSVHRQEDSSLFLVLDHHTPGHPTPRRHEDEDLSTATTMSSVLGHRNDEKEDERGTLP